MTIRTFLTLTVCCTALLGCSDDAAQMQQIPPTTGFGNRLSGLTATIPGADGPDKSSMTRTGSAQNGKTVWLIDDAITVTDGLHAGTFDVATGIGTAEGKFNGSLDFEQTPLYAVYPAVSAMNGFTAPIVISTSQNARTADADNIMIARCEEVKAASKSQFVFRKKAATAQLSFDFTSEGKYASERVNSVKITAEGVNFAGACDFDLSDPDVPLKGSSNSITYTFNETPSLADKIEFTISLTPCDLTQATNVYYLVSTDRYTFLFNKRPDRSSPQGSLISISLPLDQFTAIDNEIPAEGEVKITHELPALNLSAQGTANCYIVDKEARCSFDATVMGNGSIGIIPNGNFTDYLGNPLAASAQIAPVSAELLWETVEGLISEPVLSNGIITFDTSADKGNALIAVKDQQGRIMWSWHIWCTDIPAEQIYMANKHGNSYTFMDRNLGATSALDDTGSLGMSYQWGRKDPIPGSSKFYDMTEPTLYGSVTKVNVAASDASTGTIANAIQNPVTFFKAADWLFAGRNNYLWGNPQGESELAATHQKSIYDPCPPGYKVPGKDAFSIFTTTGENTTDPAEHNVVNTGSTKRGWYLYYAATGAGEQAWFPYNGCRYYSTGALNRGSFYYYWTTAPSAGTKSCCLAFKSDWKEVDPLYTFQRGNAQTTRCVKE